MKYIRTNFDEWEQKYQPVNNMIGDNPSFNDGDSGIMFETYGKELDYILYTLEDNPRSVWTYVDGDENPIIVNGYSLVNRIGYFVTRIPAEEDADYEVILTN